MNAPDKHGFTQKDYDDLAVLNSRSARPDPYGDPLDDLDPAARSAALRRAAEAYDAGARALTHVVHAEVVVPHVHRPQRRRNLA